MEELKATPGPWEVFGDYDAVDCPGIESTLGSIVVHGQEGELMGIGGRGKDEAFANARLIAAVPDLYTALESARKALRQYAVFLERRSAEDYPAGLDAEKQVIAALAKARGEKL